MLCLIFFFKDTATTEIYTYLPPLSLHDALPIYPRKRLLAAAGGDDDFANLSRRRRAISGRRRGRIIGLGDRRGSIEKGQRRPEQQLVSNIHDHPLREPADPERPSAKCLLSISPTC